MRQKLGVHEGIGAFQSCSSKVGQAFGVARDSLAPTFYHLTSAQASSFVSKVVRLTLMLVQASWRTASRSSSTSASTSASNGAVALQLPD